MISKENDFKLPAISWIPDDRKLFFALGSIFLLALMAYSNSFQCSFQFDDYGNIAGNSNIEMTSFNWENIRKSFNGIPNIHKGINRPLAYFSFALNYYFGGLSVFGYHLVNFTIHVLTAIFFFLWLRLVLKLPILFRIYENASYSIALLASVLWVINPIQVTAVTYIVQRMASMAAMFYIMALYFYLRGRISNNKRGRLYWFALFVLASTMAIGTKENAAMLPLIVFLFDLILIQGIRKRTVLQFLKWAGLPALSLAIIALFYYSPADLFSGYKYRSFTMIQRILTEQRVIWDYMWWTLHPRSEILTLFHDIALSTSLVSPWTTILSIVTTMTSVLFAAICSKRWPLISFLILFFFLNHAIEGSIFPLELVYEHRNYLPSMALLALLTIFIIWVINYFAYNGQIQTLVTCLVICFIIANAHTTFYRNTFFQDEFLLLGDNIAKAPNLSRQHNNLGKYYQDRGAYFFAQEEFKRAIELNRPEHLTQLSLYYENLGNTYFLQGEFNKAFETLKEGIQKSMSGSTPRLLWGISQVYGETGRIDEALVTIDEALKKDPEDRTIQFTKALLLMKSGQLYAAKKNTISLLNKFPQWEFPMMLLANICMKEGLSKLAINFYELVQAKIPHELGTILALAELYWKEGKIQEASMQVGKILIYAQSKNWSLENCIEKLHDVPSSIHRPTWQHMNPIFEGIFKATLKDREDKSL
jgi:protein O-mannosyl-transferase